MPTIHVDATSASEISQRYNVIVHSIYSQGSADRSAALGRARMVLSGLSKLAEETGGKLLSQYLQNQWLKPSGNSAEVV